MFARHRWTVLALAVVFVALAGGLAGSVQDVLGTGGFEDPGAEATAAARVLSDDFDAGDPDVVLVVSAAGSIDAPEVVAASVPLLDGVRSVEGVTTVADYWSLGSPPPLRSVDGDRALVLIQIEGDETAQHEAAYEIRDRFAGADASGLLEVGVGGFASTFDEVNHTIEEDLVRAEMIALPITLLLLVLIFRSVVAALLPLVIGVFSILGTFLTLYAIGSVTDVSVFALNFTTAMGLGLAIDYSLLVVSRFREELAKGTEVDAAVAATVRTAGRTVLFSALTVAASLVALLVFPLYFLRSFAYAGIAVVGLAALGATVLLPAILSILGERVNRGRIPWPRRREADGGADADADGTGAANGTDGVDVAHGPWYRLAMAVMRRPVPVATVAILFLLALATPFAGVELGFPDDRVLPTGTESRDTGDILRDDFAGSESQPVVAVVPGLAEPRTHLDAIGAYATELSTLDGVARVDSLAGSYLAGTQILGPGGLSDRFDGGTGTYLHVILDVEPISLDGEAVAEAVRDVAPPFDPSIEVLVGGASAELVDGKAGLLGRLPLAMGLIAAITFVVLFLSFGSLLMPLKAIVLNLLSLTATFGAMVWIFQDGHLADLLGFTATGTLVVSMPVLMFITAFGLSMDYEVFMLSRIKEEYDRTGDDVAAVANGLERTGGIVTAAAVLIAVVFIAFATGRVSFMIMFGVGLSMAVLVDAFIVRTTLVPAFMRLAGRANWWAPAPLRRLHDRIGFQDHG